MMPFERPFRLFVGTLFWSAIGFGALFGADDYSDDNCVEEKAEVDCCKKVYDDEADAYRDNHPDVYQEYNWYGIEPETDGEYARNHGLWGIFMPEGPPLYRPMMADPRELTYSVGWRFNDRVIERNVIDVSFYDRFPVFRWCDLWKWRGDLQIELEGGVWAIFDPLHDSSPLVDADYYVGVPITYAFDNWAIRLRGYHISTHIGDEFLLNHPHFDRRNPSIEAFKICLYPINSPGIFVCTVELVISLCKMIRLEWVNFICKQDGNFAFLNLAIMIIVIGYMEFLFLARIFL